MPDADASTRRLLSLAASAFVVLAAEPLYVLVDTAVVGHLGTVALAGLAVGATLLTLVVVVGTFVEYGTTGRAARAYGAGDLSRPPSTRASRRPGSPSWSARGGRRRGAVRAPDDPAAGGWGRADAARRRVVVPDRRRRRPRHPARARRQRLDARRAGDPGAGPDRPAGQRDLGGRPARCWCTRQAWACSGSAIANVGAQTIGGVLFLRALHRRAERGLRPNAPVMRQQAVVGRDLVVRALGFQVAFLAAAACRRADGDRAGRRPPDRPAAVGVHGPAARLVRHRRAVAGRRRARSRRRGRGAGDGVAGLPLRPVGRARARSRLRSRLVGDPGAVHLVGRRCRSRRTCCGRGWSPCCRWAASSSRSTGCWSAPATSGSCARSRWSARSARSCRSTCWRCVRAGGSVACGPGSPRSSRCGSSAWCCACAAPAGWSPVPVS